MLVSTKGRYAARMLVDIAVHQGDGYVPMKDVAARQQTSKKYMDAYGQTFFPDQIVKKIKESGAPIYLVSGIRPLSDVLFFKEAFGKDFVLVDIVITDDEVRYQRMLARGSERDGKSVEKLREFDANEEKQFHTSESEAIADYVIKNDGGVYTDSSGKTVDEAIKNNSYLGASYKPVKLAG